MPPNKRRGKPGSNEHRGRVTIHHDQPEALPRADGRPTAARPPRVDRPQPEPQATSRYTPPGRRSVRIRPTWHRVVGAAILVLGVTIAVLNDLIFVGAARSPLPGGHSELYLMLAFAVAGYATWWFGWFDRAR